MHAQQLQNDPASFSAISSRSWPLPPIPFHNYSVWCLQIPKHTRCDLGGVKASLSTVISSPSSPICGTWFIVTQPSVSLQVLQARYSLSQPLTSIPPNIRITMDDSTFCYNHDHQLTEIYLLVTKAKTDTNIILFHLPKTNLCHFAYSTNNCRKYSKKSNYTDTAPR